MLFQASMRVDVLLSICSPREQKVRYSGTPRSCRPRKLMHSSFVQLGSLCSLANRRASYNSINKFTLGHICKTRSLYHSRLWSGHHLLLRDHEVEV